MCVNLVTCHLDVVGHVHYITFRTLGHLEEDSPTLCNSCESVVNCVKVPNVLCSIDHFSVCVTSGLPAC